MVARGRGKARGQEGRPRSGGARGAETVARGSRARGAEAAERGAEAPARAGTRTTGGRRASAPARSAATATLPGARLMPGGRRTLDARRDTLDFRDFIYEPALVDVPERRLLDGYLELGVPILDQGRDGACTGFALATVAHYLLRSRRVDPDRGPVSPYMLYAMARRYDEWPGERYAGSSARGAMKGWHKHGICSLGKWPGDLRDGRRALTDERARDALLRPLGAYYRVNHKDLVAMHVALTEVGILYATGAVHTGWDAVRRDGEIRNTGEIAGGHAFAIVGYDERGFWIQNSWGAKWGRHGFGHLSYDDWLANGTDVWVARLGVPVVLRSAASDATQSSVAAVTSGGEVFSSAGIRPHVISVGLDGVLRTEGTFGTSQAEVEDTVLGVIPSVTRGWSGQRRRILLYAHGGLVNEEGAIQRIADYRGPLLDVEVYPLAFVWRTDYWTTLTNILRDANARRRPEGAFDRMKDFLLDRADDFLEPVARLLSGKAEWDEMKKNAEMATVNPDGGARFAASCLARLKQSEPSTEFHAVAHSAGSILIARMLQLLCTRGAIADGPMMGQEGLGVRVASCTLWAPACTMALFRETYLPLVQSGQIGRLALFALTDKAEREDDCANLYHKSLLYLVSDAFEERERIPPFVEGEPLLGMQKFIEAEPAIGALVRAGKCDVVYSPNLEPAGDPNASASQSHGAFDDDQATVRATLARVRGAKMAGQTITFHRSASGLRDRRRLLVPEDSGR